MMENDKNLFNGNKFAQSVAAGTIVIALFTLFSKALGFAREILIANLFGTSWRLDAVFIAITPVTVVTGIATGGITAIFFPYITN